VGLKMEDFDRIILKDVVVEIVNITRATYKEALQFKDTLTLDLARNFKKIVIDIRQCEFIDSTFLGVMVFIKKNISDKGGDVRIVKSHSNVRTIMEKVGTNRFFSIFDSIEAAVKSYDSMILNNNYIDEKENSKQRIVVQRFLSS
jgi:anti-anti-sigma factor